MVKVGICQELNWGGYHLQQDKGVTVWWGLGGERERERERGEGGRVGGGVYITTHWQRRSKLVL